MKYSVNWLKAQINDNQKVKFLFFWGHTSKLEDGIDKSCLSQWWPKGFTLDDVSYNSAEHWMMAEKARLFNDLEMLDKILKCQSAAEAKKLGRAIRNFDQKKWEAERYGIVLKGSIHKFSNDLKMKTFLLNTKERVLVEASPVDTIWGIGLSSDARGIEEPDNWKGENLLGWALMEARDILKKT